MNCPSCGNEVFAGDPFCDNCGADLRNMQVAPPPVAPPSVAPPPVVSPPVVPPPVAPQPVVSPPVASPPVAPPHLPTPAVVAPSPAAADPSVVGPRLVVKDTGAVCTVPVGRDIIVGRSDPIDGIFPDLDLTAHDTLTGVSRRHARIHEQGGQWFIRDLNSTNYTVVNRQRLQPDQDFLIEPGDEIRFGRLTMIFQV